MCIRDRTETSPLSTDVVSVFTEFGHASAIQGNHLLISDTFEDVNGVFSTGATHHFMLSNGQWNRVGKYLVSNASNDIYFGHDIAVEANSVMITKLPYGKSSLERGAMYTYDLDIIFSTGFESK